MANPDEPNFDEFFFGIMDASFSTVVDEVEFVENDDIILHNVSEW